MTIRRATLVVLLLAVLGGGAVGWDRYRQLRADYDGYQARIQPGTKIAGVDVGWRTREEARAIVEEQIAAPYYRDFRLTCRDKSLTLSPYDDLNCRVDVEGMVEEAAAASHRGEYWPGFWAWLQGEVEESSLDVPLRLTFEAADTERSLARVSESCDMAPVEPMVDVQRLMFLPGRPGHRLDVEAAAQLINERVPHPDQRDIDLPLTVVEPDQSPLRIESMLRTLAPVMDRPPVPPSFYTATLPLSSTGGLAGTPLVTYTGELTWTFPYFAGYTGPMTYTYGFFFDPGKPGARFDLQAGLAQVEAALAAGETEPITFAAELVPPPPIVRDLLLPPLEARLAEFAGVPSLLVKNLSTGEMLYNRNTDYVLSGMSVVKIGIMVEVYRYYGGKVDEQTHQELLDMLGSSSCNPCANRLLATLGGGSATAGAQKVTATMRQLGIGSFYLCAPFRTEANRDGVDGGWWSMGGVGAGVKLASLALVQAATPRADRCVRATPRDMADLLEMIYLGTLGRGRLQAMYPKIMTPVVCQQMIDIMAANDLRNMLGAGIPAEVKLAHKHGFAGYGVSWGDTRAEVGIVFSPGATYLVSFYIWEDSPWIDFGIVQPLYRDVSNLLYNYFNPQQPYWPRPPWRP